MLLEGYSLSLKLFTGPYILRSFAVIKESSITSLLLI